MNNEIVIRVTKDSITINGLKCTKYNFNEVFEQVVIGEYEAHQIINLILARTKMKVRIFNRE